MPFGSYVQIQNGEKEPIVAFVVDMYGLPLTGLTDIKIKVRRNSDGYYLDWSDNQFKVSPTQMLQALQEISATNSPGEYRLNTGTHVNGFDTSTFTGALTEEIYFFTAIQTPGTNAANLPMNGEIKVGGFVDDIVQEQMPVVL